MVPGTRFWQTDSRPGGDENAAVELLKSVSIHPLQPDARWTAPQWLDIGDRFEDFTPVRWERGLEFWKELHEVIDLEPAFEPYRINYGQLATLGIEKGKPFIPDSRMRAILENAAAGGKTYRLTCRCRRACSGRSRSTIPTPSVKS